MNYNYEYSSLQFLTQMKIPGENAHPVEVINAYHQLAANVKKQTQREINIEDSMAYEIQCLRKEKNSLEQQLRLQTVETRKAQKQISDLQKQLQMQSKMSYSMLLTSQSPQSRMTASGFQTSTSLTTNLKNKCKELLQNNKQLSDKIQELQNSMKYQQLTQLEKYFKVYYEKYQQEYSKNANLMQEIKDLQQENNYLKTEIDNLKQGTVKQQIYQQEDQDYDLVNNQDDMIQLQRFTTDTQNQMETTEESSDFDIGDAYSMQQMQQAGSFNFSKKQNNNQQQQQHQIQSRIPQFGVQQQKNKSYINQSGFQYSQFGDNKMFFNTTNQSNISQNIPEFKNQQNKVQQNQSNLHDFQSNLQDLGDLQQILNNNDQYDDKLGTFTNYSDNNERKQFMSIDLEKQLKDSIQPKNPLSFQQVNFLQQEDQQQSIPTFTINDQSKVNNKSQSINQIRNSTFQDINYNSPGTMLKQDLQSSTTSLNVNSHMFSNDNEKQDNQDKTESMTTNSQIYGDKELQDTHTNEDTVASLDVNSKMFN